jgi:hypothetical protein
MNFHLLKNLLPSVIIFISFQLGRSDFSGPDSTEPEDFSEIQQCRLNQDEPTKQSYRKYQEIDWIHYYPRKIEIKRSFTEKDHRLLDDREHPSWYHGCSCLPTNENETKTKSIYFAEIPGSPLFIANWNRAFQNKTLDYSIARGDLYDRDIQERYPIELYASDTSFLRPGEGASLSETAIIFSDPMERLVATYDLVTNGHERMSHFCRRWHLRCYAKFPGASNSLLKKLLGLSLFDGVELSQDNQSKAIRKIQDLAFLVVDSEWNEAVCQFHKYFGGVPHQGSFRPDNFKAEPENILKELRETYQPDLDSFVYDAAKAEFYKRYLPKGDHQRCYQKVNVQHNTCRVRSCAEIGVQCGEWPDGCGGVLVCGQCPTRRSGLPYDWRVQCSSEGQCLQTCPLWVESGIWFGEGDNDLSFNLQQKGAPFKLPENEFSRLSYVPPSDAIRMCAKACESIYDPNLTAFANEFCLCGETPAQFLADAPSAEDYLKAMAFNFSNVSLLDRELFPLSSKFLQKEHSQPRCCDANTNEIPDSSWRIGTIEAEYFLSYEMGCGGHEECLQLGLDNNADLVVFSLSTNRCDLGKRIHEVESILLHNMFKGTETYFRLTRPTLSFLYNLIDE